MSESSTNSPLSPGETNLKSEIQKATEELKRYGVTVEKLVVAYIGPRTIIGEGDRMSEIQPGVPLYLSNPRHVLVERMKTPQGLSMQYMIGDLDMLSGGRIQIIADMIYAIEQTDDRTKMAWYATYAGYLARAQMNGALQAGLSLPDSRILTPR